jgi:hypothetical protein
VRTPDAEDWSIDPTLSVQETAVPTPEPGGFALLGLGLVGMVAVRRRA